MEKQKSVSEEMEVTSVIEVQAILNDADEDEMVCISLEVKGDE